MLTGVAEYLVGQVIKYSIVLGLPELGMQGIYEFSVMDIPVTVAVDACGESAHKAGVQI